MIDEERIAYLERLNNNQEKTIIFLHDELNKESLKQGKYIQFLRDLVDECEGSLLPWQYKWVTQRINKFLMDNI